MLVAIFVHLSKRGPASLGRKALYSIQDLIYVTHVCKSWRQVAVAAPELWTEITMTKLEVVKVFLGRSGVVPLNVDLRLDSEAGTDGELLEAVVPHTRRFRQLSVIAHQGRGEIESMPFTEPAPLLERLAIHHPLGSRPVLLFDDQTPRLRELVMFTNGLWLQNQFGNLTSLHITLSRVRRTRSDSLPLFDMLRRCPVLEEMFISWGGWGEQLEPPQLPAVPLHRLRKLLLRSFRVENIKCLLRVFDLRTDGIAIHLSGVFPGREGSDTIAGVQAMFPNDNSSQPSLASSTKLELIFHTRPRTMIMHAVGPGFSIRIDLCPDDFLPPDDVVHTHMNHTFCNVFPSVKELWVRESSRVDTEIGGIENFTALEKLVLIGRGSMMARNLRQALSPDPSGVPPCPLLSAIDCHGNTSEMREMFLLLRTRSTADRQLKKVRVPPRFIPLPADIASCVGDVGILNIPPNILHTYSMELPEFCFPEGEHRWWKTWKSRLN